MEIPQTLIRLYGNTKTLANEMNQQEVEEQLAAALELPTDQVSVMELEDDGGVLFVVYANGSCYDGVTNEKTGDEATRRLQEMLASGKIAWVAPGCSCEVVTEMEEEVLIDEEEAMSLMAEGLLVVEGEYEIQ